MMALSERDKVGHLLRRFGLGASEAEIEYYGQGGYRAAVDRLIDYEKLADNAAIQKSDITNRRGYGNIRVILGMVYYRYLVTRRPLEAKLTLFWHDHFATSAQKVSNTEAMMAHFETLRENCSGSFKDLLTAVSKDPAMLYWLDNNENVKGKPNENFAREVMELFTLGIGHYTEEDVQEAARAFTGWGYGTLRGGRVPEGRLVIGRFQFNPQLHDNGMKTVLGKAGRLNGDDVIDHLCSMPRTAEYITLKMWEWFAYETPEKSVIDRIAKKFMESGLQIKTLVREIALSPEFFSDKCVRKQLKNPIDFAISSARALGAGQISEAVFRRGLESPRYNEQTGLNLTAAAGFAQGYAAHNSTKEMGMELLYPPDVAGWVSGKGWITSATMVARMKWAEALWVDIAAFREQRDGGGGGGRRTPKVNIDAGRIMPDVRTAAELVDRLLSLFDAPENAKLRNSLIEAAEKAMDGQPLSRTNINDVARKVSTLIFGSPTFQVC